MKFDSYLTTENSSGIFELKNDGTILYSRFRQNNEVVNTDAEFAGHNFFEEVAGFDNARDLRRIFNEFVRSRRFSDNFVFGCLYRDRIVPVRVMMVRAYEKGFPAADSIVILDIRNDDH